MLPYLLNKRAGNRPVGSTPTDSAMIDWYRLVMLKDCLTVPDGNKLKEGTYKTRPGFYEANGWLVTTPDVASIFETTHAGFFPSPCNKPVNKWWKD